jgi:integrase
MPTKTTKAIESTKVNSSTSDVLLDSKIDEICAGLQAAYNRNLRSIINQDNIKTIISYIVIMKTEVNLSDHYRKNLIDLLSRFSKFNNDKNFKDITRDDILAYLDNHRKTEIIDPLHKWIGTYNLYRTHLFRFFKWLYYPNVDNKSRPNPSIIEGIPRLKRKETSIYKPHDMWTQQDDLLFLKYCPSTRDKCYHAISRDLSCRPSEILRLKIRDVAFKTIGTSQYAEVVVNGKTGTRPIPLINSIPYLKDYLDHDHPQPSNPNSPLISGVGRGLGRHISVIRIAVMYFEYRRRVYPKMLENPNIMPEDKQKISELLKKPWNPYIRRHSALTEKSTILKEHVLRQHAGWSGSSQMHLKYLHYFGNESNESLLEAYGLIDKGIQIDQLRPKQCTNCDEGNKPDSKFCAKCRMVLTYDAYNEAVEEKQDKDKEVQSLKEQMLSMQEVQKEILDLLKDPVKLLEVLKNN